MTTYRLASLQNNVENASFDEKYRAISALVKSITVNKKRDGRKEVPVVTITYRFNDPESMPHAPDLLSSVVKEDIVSK